MWKRYVSIARLIPTKQTSEIKHAMRIFRPFLSLPPFPPPFSKKLFSKRTNTNGGSLDETRRGNAAKVQRIVQKGKRKKKKKKRLDYLLWQEGFRNWRGHENKRKSIAKDHRVEFESLLWHTVSKCMGTMMESWSVLRSRYLLSLSSSLTGGREWTIRNKRFSNDSISIRSRSLSIHGGKFQFSFFFLFFFPPRISRPPRFFDVLHERTVFVFSPTPPLVLDRILFDINQALKHLWACHLLSIKMYLDYVEKFSVLLEERQVEPFVFANCI